MNQDMKVPQICIAGAGLSGLVLGRCLLQKGIRTIIFEKSRSSPTRNKYGITLQSTSYGPLLKLLNVEESDFRKKVAVDSAIGGHGKMGNGTDEKSFRANRARFEGFLSEGLDIRYEHQLESLDCQAKSVILNFATGNGHETQILVGADGVHSKVRQAIMPGTGFNILPFAVYNGKRRIALDEFNSSLRPYFLDRNVTEQNINGVLFQISVDDYDSEKTSISYNYSRPAREGNDPLYRPKRSKSDATNIPEAFFKEIDSHHLQEPYKTVFHPEAMRQDRLLNWLMRTIITERPILEDYASRGVVLVGEAAHGEPILGGYGANEVIKDAMDLSECLTTEEGINQFYAKSYDRWTNDLRASEQRISNMHKSYKTSL